MFFFYKKFGFFKKILYNVFIMMKRILILFLLPITGLAAFVGPDGSPTNTNAPVPLNVGTDSQYKDGTLIVEELMSVNDITTRGNVYGQNLVFDINGKIFQKNSTGALIEWSPGGNSPWESNSNSIYFLDNVGIGTNNPNLAYSLDVAGDVNIQGDLYQNGQLIDLSVLANLNNNNGGGGAVLNSFWSETNDGNIFRLNGNVGIGRDNPITRLDVNSTANSRVARFLGILSGPSFIEIGPQGAGIQFSKYGVRHAALAFDGGDLRITGDMPWNNEDYGRTGLVIENGNLFMGSDLQRITQTSDVAKIYIDKGTTRHGIVLNNGTSGTTYLGAQDGWNYISGRGVVVRDMDNNPKIRLDAQTGQVSSDLYCNNTGRCFDIANLAERISSLEEAYGNCNGEIYDPRLAVCYNGQVYNAGERIPLFERRFDEDINYAWYTSLDSHARKPHGHWSREYKVDLTMPGRICNLRFENVWFDDEGFAVITQGTRNYGGVGRFEAPIPGHYSFRTKEQIYCSGNSDRQWESIRFNNGVFDWCVNTTLNGSGGPTNTFSGQDGNFRTRAWEKGEVISVRSAHTGAEGGEWHRYRLVGTVCDSQN